MEKERLITLVWCIVIGCVVIIAGRNAWIYFLRPYYDNINQSRLELTLENIPPEHTVVKEFSDGWVIVKDTKGYKWMMRFSRGLYGDENLIIHPYGDNHN